MEVYLQKKLPYENKINKEKFECALGYHTPILVSFYISNRTSDMITDGRARNIRMPNVKVCKHCRTFLQPIGFNKKMKDEYTKTGRVQFSWEEYAKEWPDEDAIKR